MVQKFSAVIYKKGINPCVDVPREVSEAFTKRGHIPVRGTLNNQPIRATLVPVGDGRHRLFVNTEMRKKAHVDVGDRVTFSLTIDEGPRVPPVPPLFEQALEQNKEAKQAFYQLPPSHRKEILDYLNYLKKHESLERNIKKTIAYLLGEGRL